MLKIRMVSSISYYVLANDGLDSSQRNVKVAEISMHVQRYIDGYIADNKELPMSAANMDTLINNIVNIVSTKMALLVAEKEHQTAVDTMIRNMFPKFKILDQTYNTISELLKEIKTKTVSSGIHSLELLSLYFQLFTYFLHLDISFSYGPSKDDVKKDMNNLIEVYRTLQQIYEGLNVKIQYVAAYGRSSTQPNIHDLSSKIFEHIIRNATTVSTDSITTFKEFVDRFSTVLTDEHVSGLNSIYDNTKVNFLIKFRDTVQSKFKTTNSGPGRGGHRGGRGRYSNDVLDAYVPYQDKIRNLKTAMTSGGSQFYAGNISGNKIIKYEPGIIKHYIDNITTNLLPTIQNYPGATKGNKAMRGIYITPLHRLLNNLVTMIRVFEVESDSSKFMLTIFEAFKGININMEHVFEAAGHTEQAVPSITSASVYTESEAQVTLDTGTIADYTTETLYERIMDMFFDANNEYENAIRNTLKGSLMKQLESLRGIYELNPYTDKMDSKTGRITALKSSGGFELALNNIIREYFTIQIAWAIVRGDIKYNGGKYSGKTFKDIIDNEIVNTVNGILTIIKTIPEEDKRDSFRWEYNIDQKIMEIIIIALNAVYPKMNRRAPLIALQIKNIMYDELHEPISTALLVQ